MIDLEEFIILRRFNYSSQNFPCKTLKRTSDNQTYQHHKRKGCGGNSCVSFGETRL